MGGDNAVLSIEGDTDQPGGHETPPEHAKALDVAQEKATPRSRTTRAEKPQPEDTSGRPALTKVSQQRAASRKARTHIVREEA